MRFLYTTMACALLLAVWEPPVAEAFSIYKRPFQLEYKFKSVTCYACHKKGKDENGKTLGKEILTDYGKVMKKAMGGGSVTKRLKEAKEADRETEKKVEAEVIEELLKVVKQIDKLRVPETETTWGVLLKEGKIEGIKLKSPDEDEDEEHEGKDEEQR